MKHYMRTALAAALALASGSAAALGLGQIELKSRLGQPLVAEIPIVSEDPSELEQLRAGLASPATFARIGLQPPEGVVANLSFTQALDNRGNPVIRVTSSEPIQQPLLTFLIEVDWGQGRLVREYSALLDTPTTVSAPAQPPVEAPVVSAPNTIVRDPQPEPLAEEGAGADAAAPDGDSAIAPEPPPPAAAPIPAPVPAPAGRPDRYGAVQAGETLSAIAATLDFDANLDQAMIALLNANPNAFIDGNVNLLKQGVVLRIPEQAEVQAIEAARAMAQVREQTRTWREARQPVPQPALPDAPAPDAVAGETSTSPAGAGASAAEGRLEIVPPGASQATEAGAQSGIDAGGEGDMVRQELQQTRETLAARDAELEEMKSRVAELEALQADQQKLLEMRDNELAAVQQNLSTDPAANEAARAAGGPWLVGGILLVVLALLGGWFLRRRSAARAPVFRAPDPARRESPLAAAFPDHGAKAPAPVNVQAPAGQPAQPVRPVPAVHDRSGVGRGDAPQAAAAAQSARNETHDVHVGEIRQPAAPAAPAWHAGAGAGAGVAGTAMDDDAGGQAGSEPSAAAEMPSDQEAPGSERLELARAYLDLGDHESARQLLGEVVVHGAPADRQQAERMLRDIG